MQSDFEPILERQFHHLTNYIQGIMHMGQRNIMWVRIGKAAVEKGFSFTHIGKVLHGKLHQEFGAIVDKIQVKLYTTAEKVEEVQNLAKKVYAERDERLGLDDRRDRGDFLFLHLVPVLRPQPRLCHYPGADRHVRCL